MGTKPIAKQTRKSLTVLLPEPLIRRAKRHAQKTGTKLYAFFERAIERELSRDPGFASLQPGTAAYDRLMADRLEARGESVAARGRRLRAEVLG